MADVFEEVEEQIRSARYKALALKVLPWVAGALILALIVALGVWGWQAYRDRTDAAASEQYAAAIEAFNAGDRNEAIRIWGEVGKSNSRAYKSLSLQHLGGVRLAENDVAGAVKLFDEAAEAAPTRVIGDAARLKSAFALLDTAPYKDLESRLNPLLEEGRPYRAQAREALAFAKLLAGDEAGARREFSVISLMSDAGEGERQRANAAKDLIDSGSGKAVAAAAKAAAALPPPEPQPQPTAPGPQ